MRKVVCINNDWTFTKQGVQALVSLPHTWNATDGQDGGNDYFRGKCFYERIISLNQESLDGEVWIEFRGAATVTTVYLNGQEIGVHEGGYSTFRFNLTPFARVGDNELRVEVDNSYTRKVYPQKADFTFYGGIYRDVYLIEVPKEHVALDKSGSLGIQVSTTVDETGNDAFVTVKVDVNKPDQIVDIFVRTLEGDVLGEESVKLEGTSGTVSIPVSGVTLWDGINSPKLYEVRAVLQNSQDIVDIRFGFRTFSFDAEKGFFLNGKSYPLAGVAKHQDREGVGSAVTKDQIREDLEIIREMGANTIRAAHYQHDQAFYDLANELGFIVWAEIPYITEHMPEANENSQQQMRELILQNSHHPSIVTWALSNEITATSGVTEDLVRNHEKLNELCHELDSSRPTSMAHVFMLDIHERLVSVPDICSYNLYYGWYLGEVTDNDRWFDHYHEEFPERIIGLSEFGADANPAYHSVHPEKGDYTEEYQALYHEHMLKMWSERPYLWAIHVWNMFDFGADGREEGGKPGQNQKGLVTFDRRIKKDAFYIYKAYLSNEPFVHLCGKRFVKRPGKETTIKVYSNQPEVSLEVDGTLVETKVGEKVFEFTIPLKEKQTVRVTSGDLFDEVILEQTDDLLSEYVCPGREVINWFERDDMRIVEGHYSIKDSVNDLLKNPEAAAIFESVMSRVKAAYGEVAQKIEVPKEMQEMMNRAPFESLLQQSGNIVSVDEIVSINKQLSRIQKG